jgi:AcrR family transcriptional regulator
LPRRIVRLPSAEVLNTRHTVVARSEPIETSPAVEAGGWQARKSAQTRLQVVEAAIACLVELGYTRTTTTVIADRAGLSRGAMLHHFPSKDDIVRATVEHLNGMRLKAFRKTIAGLPDDDTRVRRALQAYLEHVRHPLYVAFLDLWVAARTDAELAATLAPAQQAFEREWRKTAADLYPDWPPSGEHFDLALDLVRCVMDGIAVSPPGNKEVERDEQLVAYLEDAMRELAARARTDSDEAK